MIGAASKDAFVLIRLSNRLLDLFFYKIWALKGPYLKYIYSPRKFNC